MKIVKATWENRNLGRDAYEITLDRKDLKDFDEILQEIRTQDFAGAYVTLKMPVGDLKALHTLEDEGFRFMENALSFKIRTDILTVPSQYERLLQLFSYRVISHDSDEWENIIDTYISDDMYVSDRIYLDPYLPANASATRYKNWSKDLKKDENTRFLLFYKKDNNDPIGYSILKYNEKDNAFDGYVGGIFPHIKYFGVGAVLLLEPIIFSKENNVKNYYVHISSNNFPVLKLYSSFPCECISEQYVLRKMEKTK